MDYIQSIYKNILEGNVEEVLSNVKQAIDAGLGAETILKEGMIPAMDEVGKLFEEGEFFVPEMLIAAKAMQAGMQILKPLLIEADVEPIGKVILGTVRGDLHDIGKNLVGTMLEGSGFEVLDLGVDIGPETFVEAITEDVDIVGLSALLTTTMPAMEETIKAIDASGLRGNIKIMVGGAPITADYAKEIGADGYAPDAGQATILAKSFLD
ncbi:MAG: corrinoid protein [Chloroflexi bacterium]|nr:corrinoid protein [Chloroflexota bacterium]